MQKVTALSLSRPTGGGYAKSILTRSGERPCDNFIKERCDGVMLGTSESHNAGLCADMSRSITTEGKNGIVEFGGGGQLRSSGRKIGGFPKRTAPGREPHD